VRLTLRGSRLAFVALAVAVGACDAPAVGPSDAPPDAPPLPDHAFDVLVDDMDRNYSYFALHGTDWAGVTDRYRAAALETTTAAAFVDVTRPMLEELADIHIWIVLPDGEIVPTDDLDAPLVDYSPLAARMSSIQQIGRVAFTARAPGDYGFVAIGSLQMAEDEEAELEAAMEGLFDAPGIIIDVRNNSGGDENLGRRFASMFADEPRVYAYSQRRSGPGHDDFGEPLGRTLDPRPEGSRYGGPVVVVTGPRTMSSAEALVLMFRTMPAVTVIGWTTRGASGNPAPMALQNGVSVFYSRWKALDEARQPFERVGLAPDVQLDTEDDVLEAAAQVFEGG